MESLSSKKIALIYAGGGNFPPDFNQAKFDKWLKGFFELQMISQVKDFFLYHGAGADIKWQLALDIANIIKDNYNKYDGFVVTHSVDNILYTSALINFMIQDLSKPIVFTTSLPEETKITSKDFSSVKNFHIRSSLINATQVASSDLAEVAIVLGNHIARATHTRLNLGSTLNCLQTKNKKLLGKVQFGIDLTAQAKRRGKTKPKFKLNIEKNIKIIHVYPETKLSTNIDKYKGLFLISGNEKSIPASWKIPKNMPVYVFNDYETLTKETALAKFIWAVGQTADAKAVNKLMQKNIAGEY